MGKKVGKNFGITVKYTPLAPTAPDMQRTDRAMVRWICGVKLTDRVSTTELYALLGLEEISSII